MHCPKKRGGRGPGREGCADSSHPSTSRVVQPQRSKKRKLLRPHSGFPAVQGTFQSSASIHMMREDILAHGTAGEAGMGLPWEKGRVAPGSTLRKLCPLPKQPQQLVPACKRCPPRLYIPSFSCPLRGQHSSPAVPQFLPSAPPWELLQQQLKCKSTSDALWRDP